MKLKAIRLLLFSTAVVLLVACSGTAGPEVDIEATVEATVEEQLTATVTPTTKVVAITY